MKPYARVGIIVLLSGVACVDGDITKGGVAGDEDIAQGSESVVLEGGGASGTCVGTCTASPVYSTACGGVMESFNGVAVKSNLNDSGGCGCGTASLADAANCTTTKCGYDWLCTEYVYRYWKVRLGRNPPKAYDTNGTRACGDTSISCQDMCSTYASAYVTNFLKYNNGEGGRIPAVGDAIVFNGCHTAIITGRNASYIYYEGQNQFYYNTSTGKYDLSKMRPRKALGWNSATGVINAAPSGSVMCTIHPI